MDGLGACFRDNGADENGCMEGVDLDDGCGPPSAMRESPYHLYLMTDRGVGEELPEPEPEVVEEEGVWANKVAENTVCMLSANLGNFPGRVDDCAAECLRTEGCIHVAYDDNDGECFSSGMPVPCEGCDLDCPEGGFKTFDSFNMWHVGGELPGDDRVEDVAEERQGDDSEERQGDDSEAPDVPTMVYERQACGATTDRLGFFFGDFDGCAAAC